MNKQVSSKTGFLENSPDSSLYKLIQNKHTLLEYKESIISETDTRCKIIDYIFTKVLFWDEKNIVREPSLNDKEKDKTLYIDYIFKSNSNCILVEANKSGVYFNLPSSTRLLKRTGVLNKDTNTRDAIQQAYDYCIKKEIEVGCVTNGYQFIVFLVNSRNYRYDTYVFNDFDCIIDNFVDFINIFSPYNNAFDALRNIFAINSDNIRALPQFNRSLNNVIFNSDEKINRNPIDAYIRPVINRFFTDLVSEDKIKYLNECYCEDYNAPIG